MIEEYRANKEQFQAVIRLISSEPRLVEVSRDETSWERARAKGVSKEQISLYVGILKKLGVNEQLANVFGLGKACLIKADIAYGIVDVGEIKGYVFAPSNPRPVILDLDLWDPSTAPSTVFRPIGDGWYLFRVDH